jgi:hypothetical protein
MGVRIVDLMPRSSSSGSERGCRCGMFRITHISFGAEFRHVQSAHASSSTKERRQQVVRGNTLSSVYHCSCSTHSLKLYTLKVAEPSRNQFVVFILKPWKVFRKRGK